MGERVRLQGREIQQEDGRAWAGAGVVRKDEAAAVWRPRQGTLLPVRHLLRDKDAARGVGCQICQEDPKSFRRARQVGDLAAIRRPCRAEVFARTLGDLLRAFCADSFQEQVLRTSIAGRSDVRQDAAVRGECRLQLLARLAGKGKGPQHDLTRPPASPKEQRDGDRNQTERNDRHQRDPGWPTFALAGSGM